MLFYSTRELYKFAKHQYRYKREQLLQECVATPKLFRVLRKIKYLKGLEFLRYVGPEEWEVSNFLDLESLSISISSNRTRVDVSVWCLALKNLRRLQLAGFEEWRSIYGPNENIALEELELNDCDPTSEWPLFHQLKTLKDCYTRLVRSHHQFVLKHAKTLEKLVISYVLSGNEFFEIIVCCKNLRYLEIKNLKMQINNENLVTMLGILKENGVTRHKPFEIRLDPIMSYVPDLLEGISGSEIIRFRRIYSEIN
ncbi:uncharacterized protein LOC119555186 [Drosophila subpulchrella]|uniref:uncharacterized protein LOC119555186 n=1 Tax=Drosophila subpulchrella TaxID=1486046 RepID=UPI0018A1788D|nr:uncharacterized protein LOC119555186 [Drosophila subpulchrella]